MGSRGLETVSGGWGVMGRGDVVPSKEKTSSFVAMPALAITWWTLLEGDMEDAVLKRVIWSFQFVTSHWTNLRLVLPMSASR